MTDDYRLCSIDAQIIINIVNKASNTEVVFQRCSVKHLYLEISQNSQENACVGASDLQLY